MYQLAQPYFPANQKLGHKIHALQSKLTAKKEDDAYDSSLHQKTAKGDCDDEEYEYKEDQDAKPKARKITAKAKFAVYREDGQQTPRTQKLLEIINSKSVSQIKLLKGVGAKKAEFIVNSLFEMDSADQGHLVTDLEQLGALKGVGWKTLETMKTGLVGGGWDF